MSSGRRITIALVALVALAVGGWLVKDMTGHADPHGAPAGVSNASTPLSALPAQAAATYRLIESGGPFPYPADDGIVFDNRQHRLPIEPSGFYHEYTVPTPGAANRGARRLVTGADHELFYTGDHYLHFQPVDPNR